MLSTTAPLHCVNLLTAVSEGGIQEYALVNEGAQNFEDGLKVLFEEFSIQTGEEIDQQEPNERTELFFTIFETFSESYIEVIDLTF